MTLPIWLPLDGHQDHLALIPISIWIQSAKLYEYYKTFDSQLAYIFQTIARHILEDRHEIPTGFVFNMEEIWDHIKTLILDENHNPRRDFTMDEVGDLMALVNELLGGITEELPLMAYPGPMMMQGLEGAAELELVAADAESAPLVGLFS